MKRRVIQTRKITTDEAERCATEALQVIGTIQSHGFQLVFDPDTLCIVQHSDNLLDLLKLTTAQHPSNNIPVIGTSLEQWLCLVDEHSLCALSSKRTTTIALQESGVIKGSQWSCRGHISDRWISLEFCPNTHEIYDPKVLTSQLDRLLELLKAAHDETELFKTLVCQMQHYTHYDRVMMYRFLPDWSGEVVAESVSERERAKYLGLRFPAEDIPKQARQLYTLNPIRLFADINAPASTLVPAFLPSGEPFNQSFSILRSMSDMHRCYLNNMGVQSSLSLSIKQGEKLWGMIVFHHNEAKIPPNDMLVQLQTSGELFSEMITSYLLPAADIKRLTYLMNVKSHIDATFAQAKMADVSNALFESVLLRLYEVTSYSFIGIIYGRQCYCIHNGTFLTPRIETIQALQELLADSKSSTFRSDNLYKSVGIIPGLDNMAGIYLLRSQIPNDFYVFIGKEEIVKSIKWGGVPQTVDIVIKNNQRYLEPRSSFALWRQQVTGECSAWEEKDTLLLEMIFSAVKDFLSAKHSQMRMEQLEKSVYFDPLTGLANRMHLKYFIENFKEQSSVQYISVLFIDLDNFKDINDFMGHETGDRILMTVAHRLSENVKPSDLVVRLGGDEFVVVLTHPVLPEPSLARLVAERITHRISQPILDNAHTIVITPSMGIITEDVTQLDFNETLKQADIAMYSAKNKGKNCFHVFDSRDQDLFNKKAILTMDLRECIAQNGIELSYQPQVNSQKMLCGIEVLARWFHPKFGNVGPDTFIEIAEKNSLIYSLGLQIFEKACQQLALWQDNDKLPDSYTLSINISPIQLIEPAFERDILQLLRQYNVPKHSIRLEITESVFMNNYQTAIGALSRLRKHGMTISLDDFGTGFSSLNSLWKLPIDELKIDKSFVSNMNIDDNLFTMVESVMSLCKKLQLEVVAEGVERKIEYSILKGLGCDIYQGYFFSKPLSAEDFAKEYLNG
ncbi:bifunctional diguanylate cyclase/phosphodiesterase [Celerinatantimonas yamalensis]|uniref:EAL domain-containing protein n=1 Tax=Celerinatantimonas yamalensis TaxID=559956 RepID=A0ABW9G6D7_9GAMM